MKYYYGNTYKEAVSNDPVEICTTENLRNCEEVYQFVIPANSVLPDVAKIKIDSCVADNINDTEWMEQYINDCLSDEYGYLVEHYTWEVVGDEIVITNIYWDTSL